MVSPPALPGRLTTRLYAAEAALARLEAAWPHMVAASAFQSPGWIGAYLAAFGQIAAFRLVEIVEGDDAKPLLLLPLIIERFGPFRSADIVGGKQASLHLPVILAPMRAVSAGALAAALHDAVRGLRIDALLVTDGPACWAGAPNPLAALPHQASPSAAAMLTLDADAEALFHRRWDREARRKIRQKMSKLAELGSPNAGWVAGDAPIAAALAQFHAWKAARFAAQGIRDPFATAPMRAFLAGASAGDHPAIRLFMLKAGETPVALLGGALQNGHLSVMFNAHADDAAISRASPGILILNALIEDLVRGGMTSFDLGTGDADYKSRICPEPVALIDLGLGIGLKGWLAVAIFRGARSAKRRFKHSPRAMALLGWARRLRRAPL